MNFKKKLLLTFFLISLLFLIQSCGDDGKTANDWYREGINYEGNDDFKNAVKCYDKAISLDKENMIYWNAKGLALANMGEFSNSLKTFDRALKIKPDDKTTKENKEFVLIMSKKEK